jgi:hypothetical protein
MIVIMHVCGVCACVSVSECMSVHLLGYYLIGILMYCSLLYPVETQNITFWDSLDFIAIDTYVPLWDGVRPLLTQSQMLVVSVSE